LVYRVCGAKAQGVWNRLLAEAGLHGKETDPESLTRLRQAMTEADPTLAVCAFSLGIRERTFEALTDVESIVGSTR
jgi:hypothetical protein